jgi:hypothetical protein
MAKPNYRFAKQKKEQARKARQLEKMGKKHQRGPDAPPDGEEPATTGAPTDAPTAPAPDPTP